jgi:DNA-binding transcriptional MerR regulator
MATNGMLSTREVADLCRVTTAAVRQWRRRGHITADGLDERGRPLYKQLTAARAEAATRSRAGRALPGLSAAAYRSFGSNDQKATTAVFGTPACPEMSL